MAVLANPSSPEEIQGTNTVTYEGAYATVISTLPKLVVQHLGTTVPELIWDGTKWVHLEGSTPPVAAVVFAPELNVAGKYIYGASQGGWKPDQAGYYRITFYSSEDSGIDLSLATIGNFPFAEVETLSEETETRKSAGSHTGAFSILKEACLSRSWH